MTSEVKKSKIFGIRQIVENPEKVSTFLEELCALIPRDKKDLEARKHEFSKRETVETIQNRDLIAAAKFRKNVPEKLMQLLSKRAVRTISGVTPIGILTKPYACPGKCVYCPTEDRMPKSYMSNQPAAARALRNKFHPYDQVSNRIRAIEESGHPVSKLEVIVMGGTWSFLPHKYQNWYIKRCFDAANGGKDGLILDKKHSRIDESSAPTLHEAQLKNETAEKRIIGLTLETRPDFINERELVRMRKYGCTRIEIGVQTLDDEIQKYTKRGHYKKHVIKAMKLMKDFGFKICWHLMPGLPGTNPERDLKWMLEVFEDPMCRPDMIKIYPCVVLETAELKKWWEEGRYEPYRDEDLIPLLLKWQHFVPEYCRVMRLMRDIPVSNILDGAKFSNLRQIIKDQPEKIREIVGEDFYQKNIKGKKYWVCKDIRSREVGFAKAGTLFEEPVLKRRDYEASDGQEVFLSFESDDEEHLFALLRLRKPSGQKFSQFGSVLHDAALIREVHSYGNEVSIGEEQGVGQHRGLGRKLIEEAERIARDEWGMKRMTIIAGVGTREYYRKWGYTEKCTYMVKNLQK